MDRPKVGVGVIVINDGKVLLGKRKSSSHGDGCWHFPGGHLEFNEKLDDCAKREVLEETGIAIKNIRQGKVFTNDLFKKEGKHYITVYMMCEYDSGDVKVMEPEKCERWDWFEWSNLPQPLFIPLQSLLEQKFNPFE